MEENVVEVCTLEQGLAVFMKHVGMKTQPKHIVLGLLENK